MKKQFTATVYIIDGEKVLLIYHRKLHKWLPPGGHIEPNELPYEAAIREAKEETGLDIELLRDENIWIEESNASSIPRPYMCLLEEIPATPTEEAHQHIDQIYIGRPVFGSLVQNPRETGGLKWFSFEELHHIDIFKETLDTIEHILDKVTI